MLGARPLRRTIQREIEDILSEKILYGEIGAGEIITVDVENWNGDVEAAKRERGKVAEEATFTFTPRPKPLPAETFDVELEDEVRDISPTDGEADALVPDVPPETEGSEDDGGATPPPAGAGQPL